jgi:hypothetical protein
MTGGGPGGGAWRAGVGDLTRPSRPHSKCSIARGRLRNMTRADLEIRPIPPSGINRLIVLPGPRSHRCSSRSVAAAS